jgi:hypothetical protein
MEQIDLVVGIDSNPVEEHSEVHQETEEQVQSLDKDSGIVEVEFVAVAVVWVVVVEVEGLLPQQLLKCSLHSKQCSAGPVSSNPPFLFDGRNKNL